MHDHGPAYVDGYVGGYQSGPDEDPRPGVDDLFGGPAAPAPQRPRRRSRRRWAWVAGGLVVLLALAGGGIYLLVARAKATYDANISRFGDPFSSLPEGQRPAASTNGAGQSAMNILLLGSDSRISAGDPTQWEAGAQRTDAIILVHIPADRNGAFFISIPRDTWVSIPGKGKAKINAGFSFGGPALMTKTVESVTGVRIDHIVLVDFQGFKDVTDALGGVDICVPEKVVQGDTVIDKGCQKMDGETALTYVRQRKTLKNGDFDRVKRQQNWIRAVLKELSANGTMLDPGKFNDALDLFTSSMATDDNFTIDDMQELGESMKGAERNHVKFFTMPTAGVGRSSDGQSIVLWDAERAPVLWQYVKDDKVFEYIEQYKPQLLGKKVS